MDSINQIAFILIMRKSQCHKISLNNFCMLMVDGDGANVNWISMKAPIEIDISIVCAFYIWNHDGKHFLQKHSLERTCYYFSNMFQMSWHSRFLSRYLLVLNLILHFRDIFLSLLVILYIFLKLPAKHLWQCKLLLQNSCPTLYMCKMFSPFNVSCILRTCMSFYSSWVLTPCLHFTWCYHQLGNVETAECVVWVSLVSLSAVWQQPQW